MSEIVKVSEEKYERYKYLLLRKDAIKKEAFVYEQEYIRQFGDLIAECFEMKIECIKKKKIITYIQRIINNGGKPNQNDIDNYINNCMKEYDKQLKAILQSNEDAKKAEVISEYTVKQVKTIYYRIAKLIHPDMNPNIANDTQIKTLWNRVVIAYECNDLDEIEELEFLVKNYLEEINYQTSDIAIPNIDEKIVLLNQEINRILETDPYQYRYILMDIDMINTKKQELLLEIKDYQNYSKELDDVIEKYEIERVYA